MPRKTLLWQLYPTYLLITFAALLAGGWYALDSLEKFFYAETAEDLEARARLVEHRVAGIFHKTQAQQLDRLAKELGSRSSTRITLISPDGSVFGDSHEDPARMDNHQNRIEIRQALDEGYGTSIRFSKTVNETSMYLAVPVKINGSIAGVVRTSIPVTSIDRELRSVQKEIAGAGLIIALFAAVVSLVVARRISRPLSTMKQAAERYSRGDLEGGQMSLPGHHSAEIESLAEALDTMARQLHDRIRTITTQRNEREAILSSMVEAVLAVDANETLISMNHAALRLFGVSGDAFPGRPIHEVIRNVDLLEFVHYSLESRVAVEGEIVLKNGEDRYLQVRGTMLGDGSAGGLGGALIMLNDVTRLRRLENIRRDFVANVSHELKTPITSIKGFVETLLGGAANEPNDSRRFLEIIARHVNRLNAIIEDLLSLSRIEQDSERSEIEREDTDIRKLLQTAIHDCETRSTKKEMVIDLVCDEGLHGFVNFALLEQAIVNLVDNAIKYSEPGNKVQVEARQEQGRLTLSVRDWGCGIPMEHQPRLFERFYRVDPARSRKLGGTGLGLAIVKHISQAHNGTVSVESSPGTGSIFSIHLPEMEPAS